MLHFAKKKEKRKSLEYEKLLKADPRKKNEVSQLEKNKETTLGRRDKHKLFRLKRTRFVCFIIFIMYNALITNAIYISLMYMCVSCLLYVNLYMYLRDCY